MSAEEGEAPKDIDQEAAEAFRAAGGTPKEGPGRPTDYRPEYCDEVLRFFEVDPWYESPCTMTFKDGSVKEWMERKANPPPFVSAFARKIGVNKDTVYEWAKKHPQFSDALSRAKELRKEILVENGLMNLYNAKFAQFICGHYYGWKEKAEVENKDPGRDEIAKKIVSMGGFKLEVA